MRVGLLSSTPSRVPNGRAVWVRLTLELAHTLVASGDVLLGSVQTLPYELALWGVLEAGGRAEVLLHSPAALVRLLEILPDSVDPLLLACHPRLVPVLQAPVGRAQQASWARLVRAGPLELHPRVVVHPLPLLSPGMRDQELLARADRVVAVRLRRGGSLVPRLEARARAGQRVEVVSPQLYQGELEAGEPLVSSASACGNSVLLSRSLPNVQVIVPSLPPLPPLRQALPIRAFGGQLPLDWAVSPLPGPTLTHFTRACVGVWPGESPRVCLQSLLRGDEGPRVAAATLRRILEEGRLRASGVLVRGASPVVCFTACEPEALARQPRYRRHLLRWDFEPFGLVFAREVLESWGARPVQYLPARDFESIPSEARSFFQKHEPPQTDWQHEQEWRLKGDLSLRSIPVEAVRVLNGPTSLRPQL